MSVQLYSVSVDHSAIIRGLIPILAEAGTQYSMGELLRMVEDEELQLCSTLAYRRVFLLKRRLLHFCTINCEGPIVLW